MVDEKKINSELAAHFDQLAKNTTELRADILATVQEALKGAIAYGPEDHMGNHPHRTPKALTLDLVDCAIMVEWTDDGKRFETFAIEVSVA